MMRDTMKIEDAKREADAYKSERSRKEEAKAKEGKEHYDHAIERLAKRALSMKELMPHLPKGAYPIGESILRSQAQIRGYLFKTLYLSKGRTLYYCEPIPKRSLLSRIIHPWD